jgi:hypothetical protein
MGHAAFEYRHRQVPTAGDSRDVPLPRACSDFVSGCASFSIPPGTNNYTEPTLPQVGMVLYYLVRSTAPHVGSWGYNSARVERAVSCVP